MKRLLLLLWITLSLAITLSGQEVDKEIIMTIGDRKITAAEFKWIYNKNNTGEGILDKKTVDEYLELFVNFKLKVIEAENLGLDTMPSFIKELNGYRNQLVKPYLTDNETTEELIREAYERMETEVSASHILVRLPSNPTPDDTLQAYNRALRIIDRIKLGESFEAIARGASDDPSAKTNGGNLGYITAFRMIYPFESIVYNTDVGEITMPFRTSFGYHIIKVNDRRPSRGEVKVAHIMIATPRGSEEETLVKSKEEIDMIYERLKQGEAFDSLALTYSDDQGSARNGGELPWFGTGRMVREFEEAAFNLQNPGEISRPVQTSYGWHIIKLIEKKPLGSFEELKPEIKQMIARDNRSLIGRDAFVEKLKNEYNFKLSGQALTEFYDALNPEFLSNFANPGRAATLNRTLFSFADVTYSQSDFMNYIKMYPGKVRTTDVREYIDEMFTQYSNQELVSYEEAHLEEKYPEFKYLMQEYHDGILLFELTDKMVWSKAIKDSAGLQKFYEDHKNNYLWEDRVEATIYTCKNRSRLKELSKMLKKRSRKGYSDEDFLTKFNNKEEDYLQIEKGLFSKGDNGLIDSIKWQKGVTEMMPKNGKPVMIVVHKVIRNQPKTLDEAKGLITSDYQSYLEQEWIRELRAKYPVSINQEVVNAMK